MLRSTINCLKTPSCFLPSENHITSKLLLGLVKVKTKIQKYYKNMWKCVCETLALNFFFFLPPPLPLCLALAFSDYLPKEVCVKVKYFAVCFCSTYLLSCLSIISARVQPRWFLQLHYITIALDVCVFETEKEKKSIIGKLTRYTLKKCLETFVLVIRFL